MIVYTLLALSMTCRSSSAEMTKEESRIIFDFNSEENFGDEDASRWYESSDTVRTPGMSKAVFTLQKSKLFQRANMFALINPQPNGAGFAGMKTNVTFEDCNDVIGLELKLRGQGQLSYWKVVLTNVELFKEKRYTYEAKFQVNTTMQEFEIVTLPLEEFKIYYRGEEVVDGPPLILETIGAFGLQTFGGVYDDFKQNGVGALEIDYIAFSAQ